MLHALHQGKPGTGVITHKQFDVEADEERSRIRCPVCEWQPSRTSAWCCSPCPEPENFPDGCGTWWNTFDTRGLCPGCRHQWTWTACPSCGKWSLHEDWYETDDDRKPT